MSDDYRNDKPMKLIAIFLILIFGAGVGYLISTLLELEGYHILFPIGMVIGILFAIMKIIDDADTMSSILFIVSIGLFVIGTTYLVGYEHGKSNAESHETDDATTQTNPQ